MADCRSLIEFLRAFDPHRRRRRLGVRSPSPSAEAATRRRRRLLTSLCDDHAPTAGAAAAADAVALIAVVSALAFLVTPYIRMAAAEVAGLVVSAVEEVPCSYYAPFAAAGAGAVIAAVAGVAAWDVVGHRARRCGKPRCRGLRRAVEFDIQLETEECVRGQQQRQERMQLLLAAAGAGAGAGAGGGAGVRPVQLGDAHRELEAELRKMAPPNGRTVLIFRSPCGCPKGRMEVWGAKKVRRIKK
uniref:Ribosomal protein L34e superfamily protein n=1 Tax=Leersia perrieri TaxID=77586 RepID=A0A0D9WHY2_9ORYZ